MLVTVYLVTIQWASNILLLSDQSRPDAGSRRHRGLLFRHCLKSGFLWVSSPWLIRAIKNPAGRRGEQGEKLCPTSLPICSPPCRYYLRVYSSDERHRAIAQSSLLTQR